MWSLITKLSSPKKFFYFSDALIPWLTTLFIVLFGYGLFGALIMAPADYLQGDGFRIIYIHAPCAFLSLFVYAVMAFAAALGLIFKLKLAFPVIRHSAPMGASFTFLALLTGSLWGKPMWGTWWTWDARLTSELILLFLYISIMLLQSALAQKQQGGHAVAILVLVGFVDIPIIHYSVYWWNTLHQGATLKLFSAPTIDTSMLFPLLAMIVAFICYYTLVLFMRLRYELIAIDANYHWIEKKYDTNN